MDNLRQWFKDNNFETVKEGAEQLTAELGISVKEYEDEGLFVFNYSQIDSPKTHPVVIECRGLILTNDFTPICRPFDRFFNMGEALEITDDFDHDAAHYFEKADGSLVKVYFWNDEWHIATRGTAFAESENYTGELFESLIFKAFGCTDKKHFNNLFAEIDTEFTYIFEYTSPNNRIVTPYTKDEMVLLGARHNLTGDESSDPNALEMIVSLMQVEDLNVRAAKSYTFDTKEDLLKAVQELPGLQEGFVCYSKGLRIKIKSDVYVQVHRLRGDSIPTPKRICGLVVTNETDEYLAYFPEERTRFAPYIQQWDDAVNDMVLMYAEHENIENQKDFALKVKDLPFGFVMFQCRAKDQTVTEALASLDVNKRTRLMMTIIGDD